MFKNMSIRLKITLWFTLALIAVLSVTYLVIISVSRQAINKSIENTLVDTVAHNLTEVEYHSIVDKETLDQVNQYILFNNGFLSIDEDFLNSLNGVYSSLYGPDKNMVYGENPIAKQAFVLDLKDDQVQTIHVNRVKYFIFDKVLDKDNPEESLWLRGVVAETVGTSQVSNIARWSSLILPLILLMAIIGGYLIARRTLRPIQDITNTAATIEKSGNLKQRINLGPGKDEAHQLANTFDGMLEKLEKNFASQKQFTQDASHELRTPTSVILAQTEFILEKDRSPEEYKKSLAVIQRQGNKMANLINDMLAFTRLENNRDSYEMKTINLSKLVKSLAHDLSMIKENDISILQNIEDAIYIKGNEELLNRMISNLINNAYRYGKFGGNTWISLKSIANKAILSVKDDGPGIKKEDQEKIFERFFQADNARNTKGTGLGLPMVKEISDLHKAKLTLISDQGKGSDFIVEFNKVNL